MVAVFEIYRQFNVIRSLMCVGDTAAVAVAAEEESFSLHSAR